MPYTASPSTYGAVFTGRSRFTVTNFASGLPRGGSSHNKGTSSLTYERVLRYPDGLERRIRYPVPLEQHLAASSSSDAAVLTSSGSGYTDDDFDSEEWQTLNTWKGLQPYTTSSSTKTRLQQKKQQEPTNFQDPGSSSSIPTPSPPSTETNKQQHEPDLNQQIPDSPLELLRYLTSNKHKKEQQDHWNAVKSSYEILNGCPWPSPKPLYLVALPPRPSTTKPTTEQEEALASAGRTYAVRTRIPLGDVETELSKLLGRDTTTNQPWIACGKLVDGVVAFEDETQAQQFAAMVSDMFSKRFDGRDAGNSNVTVARVDSHALFRDVQAVDGVVVYLKREGGFVPAPHELASAVRGSSGSPGEMQL